MFCVFCLIFSRAFAYVGGPRFVAGVFAVFIFIFAMSEVGTIGKRLSNKIDNDVAVARTAPACFTMKWTNLVFHHSIIEVDGFPWRFESLVKKTVFPRESITILGFFGQFTESGAVVVPRGLFQLPNAGLGSVGCDIPALDYGHAGNFGSILPRASQHAARRLNSYVKY